MEHAEIQREHREDEHVETDPEPDCISHILQLSNAVILATPARTTNRTFRSNR
jgi:hypothetical protein